MTKAPSRRASILRELESIQQKLKEHDRTQGERIGRLAVKAGLAELEIPDATLIAELEGIAARFREADALEKPARRRGRRPAGSGAGDTGADDAGNDDASEAEKGKGIGAATPDPATEKTAEVAGDRAA